ncbi:MAG: hypothetical protein ACOX56_00305 [Acholeplasmataceae bacterium]|jgi:hypothetical protein
MIKKITMSLIIIISIFSLSSCYQRNDSETQPRNNDYKLFTLNEAYNMGLITKDDLEILNYRNKNSRDIDDWDLVLDSNIENKIIEERKKQISGMGKNPDSYNFIIFYFGEFNGAYAVQFNYVINEYDSYYSYEYVCGFTFYYRMNDRIYIYYEK